jgi:hypothetical protein
MKSSGRTNGKKRRHLILRLAALQSRKIAFDYSQASPGKPGFKTTTAYNQWVEQKIAQGS